MIRLKVTFYMRRRDVIEALAKIGISCQEVDKAIKNKVLTGEQFTGTSARAYYRAEVVAAVFGLRFEIGPAASECFLFSVPTQNNSTHTATT